MIHFAKRIIQVVQGEFRVSSCADEELSTILGSCVAACIWDECRAVLEDPSVPQWIRNEVAGIVGAWRTVEGLPCLRWKG